MKHFLKILIILSVLIIVPTLVTPSSVHGAEPDAPQLRQLQTEVAAAQAGVRSTTHALREPLEQIASALAQAIKEKSEAERRIATRRDGRESTAARHKAHRLHAQRNRAGISALRGTLRRLRGVIRAIARLRNAPDETVIAAVVTQLNELAFDLTGAIPGEDNEISIRLEQDLGADDCPSADVDASVGPNPCSPGPWLSTSAPNSVNITRTVWSSWRGPSLSRHPTGQQMSSSFVSEFDNTQVAITFSAEVRVLTGPTTITAAPGSGDAKAVFVRALVDGEPLPPLDIQFATGSRRAARSFTFTTEVDRGIHTVEILWKVSDGAMAQMRDASLVVRQARGLSGKGGFRILTAPTGPPISTTQTSWTDIPDMSGFVFVPPDTPLTATLSGEAAVDGGQPMFVRALVTDFVDTFALAPSDVVFARGGDAQARMMTFGATVLAPGWYFVRFQWQVGAGGEAFIRHRSLVLAALQSVDNHPLVVPPSGPDSTTTSQSFVLIPGLEALVNVPEKGNGEVAVLLSAEAFATNGRSIHVVLARDDVFDPNDAIELARGSGGDIKSFGFELKGLPEGVYKLSFYWRVDAGGEGHIGDVSMAAIGESGEIPDLAEALRFAGGRIGDNRDYIARLEPLIGERDVLTILWDPHRTDAVIGPNGEIMFEVDQDDIPVVAVERALFGLGDPGDITLPFDTDGNVSGYFSAISGGRFTIRNAGILGWYDALKPAAHYFTPHPGLDVCSDGFTSGNVEKWTEALILADTDFDFSAYDKDQNGVVMPDELAIIVLIPQGLKPDFGTARQIPWEHQCSGPDVAERRFLVLDGVEIPMVLEWFTDLDAITPERIGTELAYTVAAHELLHQLAGLDDMYNPGSPAVDAETMSLMANNRATTTHLDALHKLALGWVTPITLHENGTYALPDVKSGGTVYVLPHYDNPDEEEFFVVENRTRDPGLSPYDDHFIDEFGGLAIWHIVTDFAVNALTPRGETPATWGSLVNQGRRAIRLIRPWTLDPVTLQIDPPIFDLWRFGRYDLDSAPCNPFGPFVNTLTWARCDASGYNLSDFSFAGGTMTFDLEID